MNFVYVLYDSNINGVKIGHTTNINTRVSGIQVSSPVDLELLMVLMGGRELEKKLHRDLKQFNIRGEWFEFNQAVFKHIIDVNNSLVMRRVLLKNCPKIDYDFKNKELCDIVISKAKCFNKQFTIPDLKNALGDDFKLKTKNLENILLAFNYRYKQYGTSRKKYFSKED